jgi:hypothetical protein
MSVSRLIHAYSLTHTLTWCMQAELITCIVKTKAENQRILGMSLFAPHPTKTTKPDEFEHMESQGAHALSCACVCCRMPAALRMSSTQILRL